MVELLNHFDVSIIDFLHTAGTAIIVGLIGLESKRRKRDTEETQKRAAIRAEESRLAMALMSAKVQYIKRPIKN